MQSILFQQFVSNAITTVCFLINLHWFKSLQTRSFLERMFLEARQRGWAQKVTFPQKNHWLEITILSLFFMYNVKKNYRIFIKKMYCSYKLLVLIPYIKICASGDILIYGCFHFFTSLQFRNTSVVTSFSDCGELCSISLMVSNAILWTRLLILVGRKYFFYPRLTGPCALLW